MVQGPEMAILSDADPQIGSSVRGDAYPNRETALNIWLMFHTTTAAKK